MTSHRFKNKNSVSRNWKALSPDDRKAHKISRVRLHLGETLTRRRLLVIAGLVILTLLPIIWGPKLVPYRLGQELRHPIRARVDFTSENKNESEQLRERLEATFPRYYREDNNARARIFDPVYDLLEHAYNLADSKLSTDEAVISLETYAKEKNVTVSTEECLVLLKEMKAQGRRLNFYWDITVPSKKILNSKSFSAGVLSAADYKREHSRTIHILHGDLKSISARIGFADAPINIEKMPRLLETHFEEEYGRFSESFRQTLLEIIQRRLKPSLLPEDELSKLELEAAVKEQIEATGKVDKGEIIMLANQPITSPDLMRIRKETEVFEALSGNLGTSIHLIGMGLLIFTAAAGFLLYLARFEKEVFRRERRLLQIFILAVVVLSILKICMVAGLRVNLTPIGLIAGVVAIIFGARVGVGSASLLCFASFILTDADIGAVIALLGSSWIFCCLAPGVRTRSGILRAGFYAGVITLLATVLWRSASGTLLTFTPLERGWLDFLLWIGFYDAITWFVGGIILTVALPLLEHYLGASTNVTLLELSDQEHPLLRKLVLEAPGTYHHSVIIGNLAEAAAEAVGASPLLVRVASYYHDIGKIMKPEYFTENDTGRSRHDSISPSISALIIMAHVKDGVEMGRAYKLPQAILDIIEQHHGDSVISYFYQRAQELSEDPEEVSKGAFRYPGPKPQSREAAILLLADCVEAASRSLSEPTPAHLKELVNRIINSRLIEHQLDESPLTFRDISTIEASFVRTLTAMYHSRIPYKEQTDSAKKVRR